MRHRAARRALGQRAGMPNDRAFAAGDAAPSRRISSIVETLFRPKRSRLCARLGGRMRGGRRIRRGRNGAMRCAYCALHANRERPGFRCAHPGYLLCSELGREITIDFKADTDLDESRGRPRHDRFLSMRRCAVIGSQNLMRLHDEFISARFPSRRANRCRRGELERGPVRAHQPRFTMPEPGGNAVASSV
jgi:hypothetical protein